MKKIVIVLVVSGMTLVFTGCREFTSPGPGNRTVADGMADSVRSDDHISPIGPGDGITVIDRSAVIRHLEELARIIEGSRDEPEKGAIAIEAYLKAHGEEIKKSVSTLTEFFGEYDRTKGDLNKVIGRVENALLSEKYLGNDRFTENIRQLLYSIN